VVGRALGGRLLFLLSSFNFMQVFTPPMPWEFAADPLGWAGRACWLVVPAAAALGAVVALVLAVVRRVDGRPGGFGAPKLCFQVQFLWITAALLHGMASGRFPALQVWFYADFLLVPPRSGQWRDWLAGLSRERFRWLAAGWVLAGTLSGLTAERLHVSGWGAAVPRAAAYGCAVAAVLVPRVLPCGVATEILVAALFGVVNISARAHVPFRHPQSPQILIPARLRTASPTSYTQMKTSRSAPSGIGNLGRSAFRRDQPRRNTARGALGHPDDRTRPTRFHHQVGLWTNLQMA
jgi:hypothetical protein